MLDLGFHLARTAFFRNTVAAVFILFSLPHIHLVCCYSWWLRAYSAHEITHIHTIFAIWQHSFQRNDVNIWVRCERTDRTPYETIFEYELFVYVRRGEMKNASENDQVHTQHVIINWPWCVRKRFQITFCSIFSSSSLRGLIDPVVDCYC